jgi:hypothetical protein
MSALSLVWLCRHHQTRVARWHIFKPKIIISVHFEGACNESWWSILWPFGLCFGHLVYFMVIWVIFSRFGMFCQEKSGSPASDVAGQSLSPVLKKTLFRNLRSLT